jgi:hypothetical protein
MKVCILTINAGVGRLMDILFVFWTREMFVSTNLVSRSFSDDFGAWFLEKRLLTNNVSQPMPTSLA